MFIYEHNDTATQNLMKVETWKYFNSVCLAMLTVTHNVSNNRMTLLMA
jgi:hypothetical protein